MANKFWMVWNPYTKATSFRHSTLETALVEAERLARTVGGEFFVLEAQRKCQRSDVAWETLSDGASERPF
jgi:hypothetical protein